MGRKDSLLTGRQTEKQLCYRVTPEHVRALVPQTGRSQILFPSRSSCLAPVAPPPLSRTLRNAFEKSAHWCLQTQQVGFSLKLLTHAQLHLYHCLELYRGTHQMRDSPQKQNACGRAERQQQDFSLNARRQIQHSILGRLLTHRWAVGHSVHSDMKVFLHLHAIPVRADRMKDRSISTSMFGSYSISRFQEERLTSPKLWWRHLHL